MFKLKKLLLLPLLFLILGCSFSTLVKADSEEMDFSMTIVKPENQIKDDITYFDLLVKPSEKQKLEIIVTNNAKKTQKIRVTPTNAITNSKGTLDYNKQADDYKYDNSLTIPFTSLVSKEQIVDVAPGESQTLQFELEAPIEKFEGIILGSFITDIVDEEETNKKSEGVTFINKFQIIKSVVLRSSNNEDDITPIIQLNTIKPALYTYRTAVTANIQNKTPIILENVTVKATVSAAGSDKIIKSETKSGFRFAPNSNFDFPIMWDDEPLRAEKYTLNLTVETEGDSFSFKENFNISKEDSYRINNEAVELKEEKNYTLWIILAVTVIIVVALVLAFILIREKNKNPSKKSKKSRSKKSKK